jgi:hypothetical protein
VIWVSAMRINRFNFPHNTKTPDSGESQGNFGTGRKFGLGVDARDSDFLGGGLGGFHQFDGQDTILEFGFDPVVREAFGQVYLAFNFALGAFAPQVFHAFGQCLEFGFGTQGQNVFLEVEVKVFSFDAWQVDAHQKVIGCLEHIDASGGGFAWG